jgi:hypothetical protein
MLDDDSERESEMSFTFLLSSFVAGSTGNTWTCFTTTGILESVKGMSGALKILNEIFLEIVKDLVGYF